ncbi:MAG: magnesium transporter [Chloroflexi bacterium CG_4_9_14_3_um_filter_45_9]|nr:MAG: magnesium transporter [Chloroflexi bacterium CG08_land_8_20_14_0_20_45_12]PIX27555.1 MAG: magnesium transporter [Chloroflexi bacterium CG_4_8_14_3_um_filter_45_15]PJB50020.1 MAG: magnesium transporter [Chloroflexi bacterium CG_4_9_14_3_um_filter_45_9]
MEKEMALVEEKEARVELINHGKITWVYIEKPTTKEAEYLGQHFNFHPLDLDDILSRIQRPKIDEYEDYLFLVLHFPVFDKESQVTKPSEVDVFIGENYVVSVHCSGNLKPLTAFFRLCQSDEKSRQTYMGRSSGFLLYHILNRLTDYCFPILDKVTESIEAIEDTIFTRTTPETVRRISWIRRDLISIRRIIHPQIAVIETLEREEYPFFKEDQEVYFGNIADHFRKLWDGFEDCKEVVDGLADTSNWLTSHRIQETMRVLTIVMGLVALPTLVSGIFGMNISLPGGAIHGSFLPLGILSAIMAFMSFVMFMWLRHRHLL